LQVERDRIDEALASFTGAVKLLLIYGTFPLVFGVIALGRIYSLGPFEPFKLGNVHIFKFMAPAATNLAVFTFFALLFLSVLVAVIWRYFYYRKTLRFLRERGERDFDRDGNTDNFADDFLDDL
jgi:hypothetical protein